MIERVLLDTSFIIDFLRGRPEAGKRWDSLIREEVILGCCAVNIEEVYAGMKPDEERITSTFLQALYYFNLTREAARKAGEYRREYRGRGITLHTPDTLIAGVCSYHGLALVTKNASHFPMDDFPVINY